MSATAPKPLPSRSPDSLKRVRALQAYIARRAAFCLCGALARHHVGRDTAARIVRDALRSGLVRIAPGSLRNEPIYVTRKRTSASRMIRELLEASRDVEFAVGVLEQAFPGYRRGRSLSALGVVGTEIKDVLRAGVIALSCANILPKYWSAERYNATAVVLTFRHVLGTRAAVVDFIEEIKTLPECPEWTLPLATTLELASYVGYLDPPGAPNGGNYAQGPAKRAGHLGLRPRSVPFVSGASAS